MLILMLLINSRSHIVSGISFVLFPFSGWLNGYHAAQLYVFFHGTRWQQLALYSSILYPMPFYVTFKVINELDHA
jgi:hypothetical protein